MRACRYNSSAGSKSIRSTDGMPLADYMVRAGDVSASPEALR